MDKKEISKLLPIRAETKAGREKGTRKEEMTTIINTGKVEAFRRPEMKGAVTPVEIPDRSRTGMAYCGQTAWAKKKIPIGRMRSLNEHNTKICEVVFLMFFKTCANSIFRKLKKSRNIMN